MGLSYEWIDNPSVIASNVNKLGADIRSFREPLHKSVKDVLGPSIRANFDAGGRPPWPPLAESTIRKKGHTRPLIKTGLLRRRASQINTWNITSESASISDLPSDVRYGWYHQFGYSQMRGYPQYLFVLPTRPFLMIQPEDATAIEAIFDEWIAERVKRHWARRG